jgi:sugar lactone lactonase YvrE
MLTVKSHISVAAILLLVACAPKDSKPPADSTSAAAPSAPTRVSTAEGFSTPESAIWDPAQAVWFVTNVNGGATARDNNGFISRLTMDGAVDSLHFIQAGRDGVKLNGPKGTAIVGDTLWVADIDAVRGFNRKTGEPVASIELGKQARFLNDMAVGPDGTIYITDTGIDFDAKGAMSHPGPDRIFALKGRKVTIAVEGAWLSAPNGLTWDASKGYLIVVPFGGTALLGWKPGESTADTIGTGPGSQDGVEIVDGETLVTSWADSTVFAMKDGGNTQLVRGVNSPADIGVDPVRELVAIPLFLENRVEFWKLK